ncbi:DUF2635 domain-containing protein [Histophilus somni]|uniref:DUF2635 domain-containing protein n=1 Tax=Histophilus somni TaxID=731 RepID=A0AAX2S2G0_HISSO|nr:DUF2635 domain-containing protein [Histophilus somni]ACA32335.1 conserved hypothetical protein [Histophilus somni 2336]TDF40573.1 DUF2635 domain-containing protein [Histophilus somni]TEW28993.1 DUF2635 domain-containing protein [Histophilus somni]TFF01118.1 DUF2635 domain-containing protein [Histophilus somni]THA21731.1 DUF2635 domain-containing protein [Histophilus somni]
MKVKAAVGIKVPMENQPYRYIEQEPVEVEDSIYYQRRINDGDLIVVNEPRNRRNREANND